MQLQCRVPSACTISPKPQILNPQLCPPPPVPPSRDAGHGYFPSYFTLLFCVVFFKLYIIIYVFIVTCIILLCDHTRFGVCRTAERSTYREVPRRGGALGHTLRICAAPRVSGSRVFPTSTAHIHLLYLSSSVSLCLSLVLSLCLNTCTHTHTHTHSTRSMGSFATSQSRRDRCVVHSIRLAWPC